MEWDINNTPIMESTVKMTFFNEYAEFSLQLFKC